MKREFTAFLLLVFLGCASQATPLLQGLSAEGIPLCLNDRSATPSFVEKFFQVRDLTTEEGKIDYLFERIRNSKLIFIRNKVEYNGSSASEFLRWKLDRTKQRYHVEIKTAQDFISSVATSSKTSGQE